ncbi:hypothetical protein C8Q75DRAFT_893439 [Abortiporus biennis]|nr:hypothetical protein C8Q75DRAFT_893439 [Abortiporus biennis]
MAAIPDRKTLESLRRADLQKLCKDHGLRANLKSEALIDLLVDTIRPSQIPQPKRNSSMRIISKSNSTTRTRGYSGGSVIIHDSEDEREPEEVAGPSRIDAQPPQQRRPSSAEPTLPPHPPARSTRKAKDTQLRLGVGRPALAGGSGARAVTKSTSLTRAPRGKASVSVRPTEAAIQEENEDMPEAGPSGIPHNDPLPVAPTTTTTAPSPLDHNSSTQPLALSQDITAYLSSLIDPLRQQIGLLQGELQQTTIQRTSSQAFQERIAELSNDVVSLKSQLSVIPQLEAEIHNLKRQVAALSLSSISHIPSSNAGTSVEEDGIPSRSNTAPSEMQLSGQVLSQTALGKRRRTPEETAITGVIEQSSAVALNENQLATQVVRPNKKRQKLGVLKDQSPPVLPAASAENDEFVFEGMEDIVQPIQHSPGPAFTVFSGPEPAEELPQGPLLPQFSDRPAITPPNPSGVTTSTANANENAQPNQLVHPPFDFAFNIFQPMASTPMGGALEAGLPSFPHPEPPTSPTPINNPAQPLLGARRERLGSQSGPSRPAPARPRSAAGRQTSGSHDVLSSISGPSTSDRESSNNTRTPTRNPTSLPSIPEVNPSQASSSQPGPRGAGARKPPMGIGLGLAGVVPLPMPPDTPAPPMKRTMYGTELETDTRFGDFGVEGVATGFWTSGIGPRF